jgi:2-hydroxy-6-oxonona-2,4-dienedioate hydrolase
MVAVEVSIAILNHIAHSRVVLLNNCGHWPPFEKPTQWAAVPQALLSGRARSKPNRLLVANRDLGGKPGAEM